MSTTLPISQQIEQVLLEEGTSKDATTRRFNKMAGLFSQTDKSPWDFTLKVEAQKRLAYAGFLLAKFGGSIPTNAKKKQTEVDVLFGMSDLGKVTVALEKALKEDKPTFASVLKAYEKAVARMEATARRKNKEAIASGDKTKTLAISIADRLEAHQADIVKSNEADEAVSRIKAWVTKYEAQKVTKAVTIKQSEPELINA